MTELTPEDRTLLDLIVKRVDHFEQTFGNHYSNGLWTRLDKLYHSYTDLRRALRDTSGQQRDDIYRDARKEFGHELFVPHAYAIVETVLPALLSNRPRLLILARNGASERNVENMRAIIDAQQSRINLEMELQSVAKSGLQYGLGVGKSYWLRREGQKPKLVPLHPLSPYRLAGHTHTVETCADPLFDDPTFEAIPVRDFGWDQFAAGITKARFAWHRTWRDTAYVNDQLASTWLHVTLAPEDVETGNGSAARYRKSVRGPFEAQGIPIPASEGKREVDIHEVIEYHDGGQIVTVLDRKWVVNVIKNEVWYGRLPFHIYRPTEVLNQFVGKGEIEPIEDLQLEMNMMRTDRRWADLMALNPVIFYDDGLIDPDKIRVGPGEMNAVNGNPNDIIKMLEIKPPSNTSYRETAEIATDIVRTSGISDTYAGGDGGSQETATGAQLQMARASARIQLKTQRAETEMMKPIASHWGALNQRHIIKTREERAPLPPVPGEPERRWQWFKLGPNELAGEFDYEPDGGSTTPDNIPQMRQDAQILTAAMAGPLGGMFDPRQIALKFLEKMSIKNPESILGSGQQPIPPEALQMIGQQLVRVGMDPGEAQQLIQESVQAAMEAKDQQAQAANHGQDQQGQQQQAA